MQQEEQPDKIEIRSARLEDAHRVYRWVEKSTLDTNSLYFYLMMFSYFQKTSAVAFRGDQGVGFVCGFEPEDEKGMFFCWQIGVDSSCRGQGVARKLLDFVFDQGQFKSLSCTITPSNESSHRLFQSFASHRGMKLTQKPFLLKSHFGQTGHEPEDLVRIAP